jgi:hypothetical protein
MAPNEMETSFADDLGMLRGLFASAERFITLFHSESRAGPSAARSR